MGLRTDPDFAREMARDEEILKAKKAELKSLLSGPGMDEQQIRALQNEYSCTQN